MRDYILVTLSTELPISQMLQESQRKTKKTLRGGEYLRIYTPACIQGTKQENLIHFQEFTVFFVNLSCIFFY